jgi:ATP-dependent Lon protease
MTATIAPGDALTAAAAAAHASIPDELAILPTRDGVLFPVMGMPATIGGEPLLRLLDEAVTNHVPVAIVAQRPNAPSQAAGQTAAPPAPEASQASQASEPPGESQTTGSSAAPQASEAAEAQEPSEVSTPESPPPPDALYRVGTVARIVRLQRRPDGAVQVIFQGVARVRLVEFTQTEPYLRARVLVLPEASAPPAPEVEALRRTVLDLFRQVVALSPALPDEAASVAAGISGPGQLADFVVGVLDLPIEEKQTVLEALDVQERLRLAATHLERERQVLELGRQAYAEISGSMQKAQREALLRAQLAKIQQELGELDPQAAAAKDLRERVERADLPDEARREAEREVERLAKLPEVSPEYHLIRTYLDWLLALPWHQATQDDLDLAHARAVLDEDHYGLERVKERILEYLAVRQLKPDPRGPILCFVGAPGVGKTSLGQSIARALGRKFARMSLGGLRDEAEIRGHRRTYVGALPGRIIQLMRRAVSNNPVFMLDEVDKLAVGFQGDPAAALLEVLDPEQNEHFVDLYLDVPFDLSRVLFIATANVLDTVPGPLRDRMEVIELPGYTEQEKLEIARRHLLPRQLAAHGLQAEQVDLPADTLRAVIRGYTREAGVRNLEREMATICRKVARRFVEARGATPPDAVPEAAAGDAGESRDEGHGAQADRRTKASSTAPERSETQPIRVTPADLTEYLGPRRFREEVLDEADEVGVATGLSVTPAGGEVLFIEASAARGDGHLELTGQLGDVMKESVKAALTYLRSRAETLHLPAGFPGKYDVHVHVPAGAVPKDGPSAGVAMATALASAVTHRPVRREVAMTGEITLRGKVLPIGGVKEKVLAAHRAGVKTVLLPAENEKDLYDVPAEVREDLRFVFLDRVDQALEEALRPAGEAAAPRRRRQTKRATEAAETPERRVA